MCTTMDEKSINDLTVLFNGTQKVEHEVISVSLRRSVFCDSGNRSPFISEKVLIVSYKVQVITVVIII